MFFYYKRTDNKLQERAKSLHPPQILRRNKQGKAPRCDALLGALVRVVRLERTVSWSQTRRDTNFAIPGYSLFCHDTTANGKNKVFSVCGQSCGQSRFYAAFSNRGKSRKRRCHKALRRFALPRPGYRHGTPKCGTVPTPPYPDRGGGTPPDHGRRTLTISDFLRSCKGEISRSERPSEPPHGR